MYLVKSMILSGIFFGYYTLFLKNTILSTVFSNSHLLLSHTQFSTQCADLHDWDNIKLMLNIRINCLLLQKSTLTLLLPVPKNHCTIFTIIMRCSRTMSPTTYLFPSPTRLPPPRRTLSYGVPPLNASVTSAQAFKLFVTSLIQWKSGENSYFIADGCSRWIR